MKKVQIARAQDDRPAVERVRRVPRELWQPRLNVITYPGSWIASSVTGTPLDESNARKALNRILDAAGLHRRGPHQLRHTFASLVLQQSVPITYVSQQLGHRDSSITLRACTRIGYLICLRRKL